MIWMQLIQKRNEKNSAQEYQKLGNSLHRPPVTLTGCHYVVTVISAPLRTRNFGPRVMQGGHQVAYRSMMTGFLPAALSTFVRSS